MVNDREWSPNIRNCAYCKQPFELNKGNYYMERDSRRKRRFHVGHLEEFLLRKLLSELAGQGKSQQEVAELMKRGIIQNAIKEVMSTEYEYIPASQTGAIAASSFGHKQQFHAQEASQPTSVSQQQSTSSGTAVSAHARKKKQSQPDMTWLTGTLGKRR